MIGYKILPRSIGNGFEGLEIAVFEVEQHDAGRDLAQYLNSPYFEQYRIRAAALADINTNRELTYYESGNGRKDFSVTFQRNIGEARWYGTAIDNGRFNPDCIKLIARICKLVAAMDAKNNGGNSPENLLAALVSLKAVQVRYESAISNFMKL